MRDSSSVRNAVQIPGFENSIDKEILESPLLLLIGGAGSGKTMYCRQFLLEGQALGGHCIFLGSDMTEKQYLSLFSKSLNVDLTHFRFLAVSSIISNKFDRLRSTFLDEVSATDRQIAEKESKDDGDPKDLLFLLEQIQDIIKSIVQSSTKERPDVDNDIMPASNAKRPLIRLVFDSVSYLEQFFEERLILKFIAALSSILRDAGVTSVFTFSVSPGADPAQSSLVNSVSSMLDGVIEMKLVEDKGSISRSIRLLSIKGHRNIPTWIQFKIGDNGFLTFEEALPESPVMTCELCGKPIRGNALMYLEKSFDSSLCLDTYKKLSGIYGSAISPSAGLPSDVVNLHFFFIDIVGLSDPSLSVKRQMEKIALLNNLVRSCPAFKGVPKDKKIVLPTGDGIAIGFLLNAELPLQLSIQLHKLLKSHNELRRPEDRLGIRIGISSGHVFIHDDINGNQNVWGPGIILARRVMDLGDNLHILLEGNMAKGLMELKDEYQMSIRELCDHKIKHGQTIKIFSAYSNEFGNPELPAKLEQSR